MSDKPYPIRGNTKARLEPLVDENGEEYICLHPDLGATTVDIVSYIYDGEKWVRMNSDEGRKIRPIDLGW